MSAAAPFSFAGQSFQMLADRALFWPRHGALIVADLHLEKGSWYAALGQPRQPVERIVAVIGGQRLAERGIPTCLFQMQVGDDQRIVARPEQRATGQRHELLTAEYDLGRHGHGAAMAPSVRAV